MSIDKQGNMNSAEKFTRTVFGMLLIASFFFMQGRWVALVLGILFLVSVATGWCITCWAYNKFFGCKECAIDAAHEKKHGN
jgi:hypothetical protein